MHEGLSVVKRGDHTSAPEGYSSSRATDCGASNADMGRPSNSSIDETTDISLELNGVKKKPSDLSTNTFTNSSTYSSDSNSVRKKPSNSFSDSTTDTSTSFSDLHSIKREADQDSLSPEQDQDGEENTKHYLSTKRMIPLTLGLMLAMFIVALDNTIISPAIPVITTDFDSLDDAGWYGSVYLLATVVLQPVFGKIYSFWNVKWIFVVAILIFELGSIIDAVAQNSPMFIVGRAIAGCGAAGVYAGVILIVGLAAPLDKRPAYISCVASTFAIAAVAGPLLGGVLTGKVGWRW